MSGFPFFNHNRLYKFTDDEYFIPFLAKLIDREESTIESFLETSYHDLPGNGSTDPVTLEAIRKILKSKKIVYPLYVVIDRIGITNSSSTNLNVNIFDEASILKNLSTL